MFFLHDMTGTSGKAINLDRLLTVSYTNEAVQLCLDSSAGKELIELTGRDAYRFLTWLRTQQVDKPHASHDRDNADTGR